MIYATRLTCLLALVASMHLSEAQGPNTGRIIYPDNHTRWKVGQRHTVIWDVNDIALSNKSAIFLSKDGQILTDISALALDFHVQVWRVKVEVPRVKHGKYKLYLSFDIFKILSDSFTIESE